MTRFDTVLARAKAEIIADLEAGTIPASCASFGDLHNYVDANGYGGAFEESNPDIWEPSEMEFWNEIQDTLNAWIVAGALRANEAEFRKGLDSTIERADALQLASKLLGKLRSKHYSLDYRDIQSDLNYVADVLMRIAAGERGETILRPTGT